MWHEARKQEKKIRGLMVDYKKRAERRRQYYERIKLDPTQFVRVFGRPLKIHLEQSVALLAESPQSMMPWQGQTDNMIDRFDVRAHLDYIPEKAARPESPKLTDEEAEEERQCNYERYRMIVQNECTGVTEDQCLRQIYIDEQFGALDISKNNDDKKKNSDKKAAIGYTYEDSTTNDGKKEEVEEEEEEEELSSDDEVDLDVAVDVDALTDDQAKMLNVCAVQFGMDEGDYVASLKQDKDEAEAIKLARLLEEEKAQFSGRKSRRERRAYKEKRLAGRAISPPSYAAKEIPKQDQFRRSPSSNSRSPSPENAGQVQFITSFGLNSDDENKADVLQGPSLPPPTVAEQQRDKNKHKATSRRRRQSSSTSSRSSASSRGAGRSRRRTRSSSRSSRSRSRSPIQRRYRRSKSTSRSRSRDRRRQRSTRSRSRSRSYLRNLGQSRTKSRSPSRDGSRSYSRNVRQSRSKSRSRSKSSSSSSSKSSSRSNRSRSRSRSRSSGGKPPIKRYRRPSLDSSNESSDSDESEVSKVSTADSSANRNGANKVGGKTDFISKNKLTPQEKLRRRMQLALNRQYKADKKAMEEKVYKSEQLRVDREEELRMLAIQMRRREREKRHRERETLEDQDTAADAIEKTRASESSRWTSEQPSEATSSRSESRPSDHRPSRSSREGSRGSHRTDSSRMSSDDRTRSRSRTREDPRMEHRRESYSHRDDRRGGDGYERRGGGGEVYDRRGNNEGYERRGNEGYDRRGNEAYRDDRRGGDAYRDHRRGGDAYREDRRGYDSYNRGDRSRMQSDSHHHGYQQQDRYDNHDRGSRRPPHADHGRSERQYDGPRLVDY